MWQTISPLRPVGVCRTWKQDGTEHDQARTSTKDTLGASHNRPHTLWRNARTDDAFPLSVRGLHAMAGARQTPIRARRNLRPTKGGAVRIRIALTTAVAVIVSTGAFFLLLGNSGAASARNTTHQQVHTTHHV